MDFVRRRIDLFPEQVGGEVLRSFTLRDDDRTLALHLRGIEHRVDLAIRLEPDRLHVDLKGDAPPALFVRLAHATRAGYDMRLRLVPVAPGAYEAELGRLPPGRWQVIVEDPRGSWRIARETP